MGSDKKDLPVAGETLLDRMLSKVRIGNVAVVAKNGESFPGDLRFVADQSTEFAPIFGVDAALGDASMRGAEWAVLLAVDLPFLRTRTISRLTEIASGELSACRAVVPEADGFLQTLAACYRPSLRAEIATRLAEGKTSLHHLIRSGPHRIVSLSELGAGVDEFRNVNTPGEAESAEQQLASERIPVR